MDSIKSSTAAVSRPTSRSYGSEQIQQVKSRAANFQQPETNTERRGLQRFNELTAHNNELRRDVPRGFYLNITV